MILKGKMLAMLAMCGMFSGGAGMAGVKTVSRPERNRTKSLSLEERTENFEKARDKHNMETLQRFPKWQVFIIDGFGIVASNLKNAHKQLNLLVKSNGLTLTEKV